MSSKLLRDRMRTVLRVAYGHKIAAEALSKRHLWFGVPVVVLTTIVGTTAFASLTYTPSEHIWIGVLTGVFSATAAVLAALQTFFSFSDNAKGHAVASAKLFGLWRRMQILLVSEKDDVRITEQLSVFDEEFSEINQGAPLLSRGFEDKADKHIEGKHQPGQQHDDQANMSS